MMFCSSDPDDPDDPDDAEGMGEMFGPGHADQSVRQAIMVCWMSLPKEKRSVDEAEQQVRRLVDRALDDLREDSEAFGLPSD